MLEATVTAAKKIYAKKSLLPSVKMVNRLTFLNVPHIWLNIFKHLDYKDLVSCQKAWPSSWNKLMMESPEFVSKLQSKYLIHQWLHGRPPSVKAKKSVGIHSGSMYPGLGVLSDQDGLVVVEYELIFTGMCVAKKIYTLNRDLSKFKEISCQHRLFGLDLKMNKDSLMICGREEEYQASLYHRWTLEPILRDKVVSNIWQFGSKLVRDPRQDYTDSIVVVDIDEKDGSMTERKPFPILMDSPEHAECPQNLMKQITVQNKYVVSHCGQCGWLSAQDLRSGQQVWTCSETLSASHDHDPPEKPDPLPEAYESDGKVHIFSRSDSVGIYNQRHSHYHDADTGKAVRKIDKHHGKEPYSSPPDATHKSVFNSRRFVGETYIVKNERYLAYVDLWSGGDHAEPKMFKTSKLFYKFRANMHCAVILDRLLVMVPTDRHISKSDYVDAILPFKFTVADQNLDVLDLCAENPFKTRNRISNPSKTGDMNVLSNGWGYYSEDDYKNVAYTIFDTVEPVVEDKEKGFLPRFLGKMKNLKRGT